MQKLKPFLILLSLTGTWLVAIRFHDGMASLVKVVESNFKPREEFLNFVIIGVKKCGTTSLGQFLQLHPQIMVTRFSIKRGLKVINNGLKVV